MMGEETTKWNSRVTALAAVTAVPGTKSDVNGRLDIAIQSGFAAMELTRLSGAEGRKGKG